MSKNIRWMIRSDMDNVAEIRTECMSEGDLFKHINSPSFILKVFEVDGKAVGFIRYKNCKKSIKIMELAVSSEFRRKGVATELVRSILAKTDLTRKTVESMVPEELLDMQCMYRKLGFVAKIIRSKNGNTRYNFVIGK